MKTCPWVLRGPRWWKKKSVQGQYAQIAERGIVVYQSAVDLSIDLIRSNARMPNPQVQASHSCITLGVVHHGVWQSVKADLHWYASVKFVIRMTPHTHTVPFLSHSLCTCFVSFFCPSSTSEANKSVWQRTFLQREAVVKELRLQGLEIRKRKRMRQGHSEAMERKRDEAFLLSAFKPWWNSGCVSKACW